MQKPGLSALLGIVGFALIFALWPGPARTSAQTGATLSDVRLSLYPSRDADAVWQFRAARVMNDPLANETHLTGLSDGQRLVKERGPGGRPTGRQTLDATLRAPDLTIDGQDNMTTRQARITLVRQCADIDLTGTAEQPVKIEQGQGFSAPVATLDSPLMTGHVEKLRMTFDFNIEDSDPRRSKIQYDLDGTQRCVNGRRVPGA